MAKGKLIIVGGRLAGLMATIKAAEKGVPVQLCSWFRLNGLTLVVPKAELPGP